MNDALLPCGLIVDPDPQSGQRNMDIDGQLLQRVVDDASTSVVRIYRWARPTVSLGYFQKHGDQIDPRLENCDRVKRITGGGAILHDDELTYSCAVPPTHPARSNPTELYCHVHAAVIDLLKTCGVECAMRKDVAKPSASVPP